MTKQTFDMISVFPAIVPYDGEACLGLLRSPEQLIHVGLDRTWRGSVRRPHRLGSVDRLDYRPCSSSARFRIRQAKSFHGLRAARSLSDTLQRIDAEAMASPSEPPLTSEATFEQLFKRYFRSVSYYFARRGCSPEVSQDLAQETFISAYKGMDSFRREGNIQNWLFSIASNIWRNWLRGQNTLKRGADEVSLEAEAGDRTVADTVADTADGPLDSFLSRERHDQLRNVFAELPPRMLDCLLLRLDQGLKYREIADIMQTSVETVKSQLYQARERLKKLTDYVDDL